MPVVDWGIDGIDSFVDDFDRESQITPYKGVTPPNGVYQWQLKTLQFVAATDEKWPQLRMGFELVPRNSEEKQYKGYWLMKFCVISDNPKAAFNYAPFLDAIGVSGDDFARRTRTDEEGKVLRIGKWKNESPLLLAQLQDDTDQSGNPRKKIGWIGPVEDSDSSVDEEEEEYYDEEEEEEAPPPRKRTVAKKTAPKKAARRRATADYDEDF